MSTPSLEHSSQKLADTAEQVKTSTKRVEKSTERVEDSADRRTQLAADRTILAAERTYAAWVRTGFVGLASGVGAKKLLEGLVPEWLITANATVLILFSAFCFLAAVWRQINDVSPPPRPDTKRIPPALLMALNGFLALVSLAALVGIWFGRTAG